MAMPKKMFHVELLIDAIILHDIMQLSENKALQILSMKTVKHGGVDEETGALKSAPTGKEVVMALTTTRRQFTTTELSQHAESVGVSRTTAAAALHALLREGVIKRFAPMTYGFSPNAEKAEKARRKNGAEPHRKKAGARLGLKEGSISSKIVAAVRAKQNGSGEGVPLATIKEMVGAKDNNISPQIFDLMKAKRLIRVGKGAYRVGEGA